MLHCVFPASRVSEGRTLRVRMRICGHAQYVTACNVHLRCANKGTVRILLLPGANAPNVHKCTFATYGEKNLKDDIYGMTGVEGQTLGVPGPDQARPTQYALFGTKVKGQKVAQNPPRTYYYSIIIISMHQTIGGQRKCFYPEFHALSDHQKTVIGNLDQYWFISSQSKV